MRRAKIVCTIGPATNSEEMITNLIKAGMNVARINFSHGEYEDHKKTIETIRRVSDQLDTCVGIMQDLQGPKIRIGKIKNDKILLEQGRKFTFTTEQVEGNEIKVTLPCPELPTQLKKNQIVYVDDARLEFKVISTTKTEIFTKVTVGGYLGSRKGFTAPGASYNIPSITEKDKEDLKFGIENGVDWIASSFVRTADDIKPLQKIMREMGKRIPIIAKIERPEAIKNIKSILDNYEGIMVARGDLGIELSLDEVPIIQKNIIRECNRLGRPVITATQMLDSMMSNPRPTRAEVSDVANAVIDGSDAVMLSGETAVGKYPIDAVTVMDNIITHTEKSLDIRSICHWKLDEYKSSSVTEAVAESSANLATELNATAIITCTYGGQTARMTAKYRPSSPIIAAASSEETARKMTLFWGVHPINVSRAEKREDLVENALHAAMDLKLVKNGDTIVMVAGVVVGMPGNTSMIQVMRL